MNVEQRDREALVCVTGGVAGRSFTTSTLGSALVTYIGLFKNRYDYAYMTSVRLEQKGYTLKIGRGLYQLTELGAAWCGAARVANT